MDEPCHEGIVVIEYGIKEVNKLKTKESEIQFLYPNVCQFPFDKICEQIVRELEKRNWDVPGIDVRFREYGSGAQKFRIVSEIKSHDFRFEFCRVQRTMPSGWNDTAAVARIIIPKKELHVYEDESGPNFYLYVGNDYERDREKFMNGLKVNSKLDGKPRIYLKYKGGCDCQVTTGATFEAIGFLTAMITSDTKKLTQMTHTHRDCRPPLLIHTNDSGREYDPKGNEPKLFRTSEVMAEFKQYLEEIVLKMITSHPIPTEKINIFVSPEPIPFSKSVGPLFCFGEYCEAERIKQGKADPDKLDPSDRYGLSGGGYRPMPLGTPNDGTVPNIAYEGFLWCGIGKVTDTTAIDSLEVPGHYRWSHREQFVIRIKPNWANDIYIADHAQYEKRRKEISDSIKNQNRKEFTDAEVADFTCAFARTIVPISEYSGEYKQPVVLVNRELSFDEVEVVSGPHKNRYGH